MLPAPEKRRDARWVGLLNDLATLAPEMGGFAEAESLMRESIELAKTVYGADSLPVAHAMNNMAVQLVGQGRLADGEQAFRAAYERHRAVLGEDHWDTVNVARNVGWTLALEQRYDDALSWMDQAIAAIGRASGDYAGILHHMQGRRAVILLRLGRSAEAIAALASTLAAVHAARAPTEAYIVTDLQLESALALLETGRAAEAESFARAGLAGDMRDEPMRALAECLLGWSLAVNGHRDEGRKMLDRALPVYRRWGRADPRTVASIDRMLADSAH
jgi:tetratricopeptide (TPR) repeat protein